MLNKIILMGRLTRDPELRYTTQSNMAVCTFTLAVDRNRKSSTGERQTDFLDCVAWGRQAEFVTQWFAKGVMAIVVGQLQTRKWQDKEGKTRTAYEIQCDEISFGETKKVRETYQSGGQSNTTYSNAPAQPAPAASTFNLPKDDSGFEDLADDDSELPF